MFHVIASDLDGTLLTSNNKLTFFTKKILRTLVQHNVHFVFATGRHHNNVLPIRNDLNIPSYMITSNGSRIYNTYGQLIASYNLNTKIAFDLINMINCDPTITINIFRNETWLIKNYKLEKSYSNVKKNNENLKFKIYKRHSPFLNGINKIYLCSNNCKKLLFLEEELLKKWEKYISISFSLPTCLEIMPQGISKGYALQQVIKLLGFQLKDCISFGDGMNDQEMLSLTGKGCIMRNAQQRLKDTLPSIEIIESNTNEAVPNYLKNMYFNIC